MFFADLDAVVCICLVQDTLESLTFFSHLFDHSVSFFNISSMSWSAGDRNSLYAIETS